MPISSTLEIPGAVFADRRRRAVEEAERRGLAGLLVWSAAADLDRVGDVLYLSNHHSPATFLADTPAWTGHGDVALLLTITGDSILLSSLLEQPDDATHVGEARMSKHLPADVATELSRRGLADKEVGIVARALPYYQHRQIADALGHEPRFVPADDILDSMRSVKDDWELMLLRRAVDIGSLTFNEMFAAAVPGATPADVVAAGSHMLTKHGGRLADVAISVGAVPRMWGMPTTEHWDRHRPLKNGDLLRIDQWGPVDGYWTDFGRATVIGGDPTDEQARVLSGSIDLIEAIRQQMRPGATFGDIYAAGLEWMMDNDWLDEGNQQLVSDFFPSFGHSLGLSAMEPPFIVADNSTRISENMVICVEGGVGLEGTGSGWFEHVFLQTPDGTEVLDAGTPDQPWGDSVGLRKCSHSNGER